jgi:hypothetical protein
LEAWAIARCERAIVCHSSHTKLENQTTIFTSRFKVTDLWQNISIFKVKRGMSPPLKSMRFLHNVRKPTIDASAKLNPSPTLSKALFNPDPQAALGSPAIAPSLPRI